MAKTKIEVSPEFVELFKKQTTFMARLCLEIIGHELDLKYLGIAELMKAYEGQGAKCTAALKRYDTTGR